METYNLENDLSLFGVEVKNFPDGIGDAFDKLVNMITTEFNRSYYGISKMSDHGFTYIAAAEEKHENEAKKYNCVQYNIEKGEYLTVTLKDWRKQTDSIKAIFQEMCKNPQLDKTKPCIEWYKNDEEMLCMIKIISKIILKFH